MKKYCLVCLSFAFLQTAFASMPSSYHWTGGYLGLTAGGTYSSFNPRTITGAGALLTQADADAVNQFGNQTINTNGFVTGLNGGYNWQFDRLLVGLEADLQSSSANGSTTSGAVPYPSRPDTQFVENAFAYSNWLFTARPRVGVIANNWLVYATGGLGLTVLQADFMFTDSDGVFEAKRVSQLKGGYVIGAGVEAGLTHYFSVKAEYQMLSFDNTSAHGMGAFHTKGQVFSSATNLRTSLFQVGLNYHFTPQAFSVLSDFDLWQIEMGARAFGSSGVIGAPQPLLNGNGTRLFSRLTYGSLTAISEETAARFDHANGFFIKGYLGAGSVTHGQLNDEDFPAGGAYSNTLSNIQGNLSYADLDVGYAFFKTPHAKTGSFIGYQYNAQNVGAYGCRQLAGATVCVPSSDIKNVPGIVEEDTLRSLRLGLTSTMDLTDQLSLNAEATYVPLVDFRGQDNHNLRQLVLTELSSYGTGTMLETVLGYQLNPFWNIGMGARYWAWNMRDGSVAFDFLGETSDGTQAARYTSERYGVFIQLNYKDKPSSHVNVFNSDIDWRGLYIGGFLGGAWSDDRWHDPFDSTIASSGRTNQPGFGDKIHATGPLGGVDLYYHWQTNDWVYGLSGSVSVLDVRGENTLFSGLGGINGQQIQNDLATLVAKAGVAHAHALYYVNLGAAELNTRYLLNGDTDVLSLGTQSKTTTRLGWTAGVGVDYPLTEQWTTYVEYNYVAIPSKPIAFPEINVVNTAQLSVRQTMNLFKLGLAYKL